MVNYEIRGWVDVLAARRAIRILAGEIGFFPREATELSIVASELGSNILKYGRYGSSSVDAMVSAAAAAATLRVSPDWAGSGG